MGITSGMGLREELGIEITDKSDGTARLRMDAQDVHLNDGGIVHGGALATLADCAMGSAVASTLPDGQLFVTVEAKINFLEATEKGGVVATAKVRRTGKSNTVAEAELVQESTGEVVAFATGTFTILD